MGRARRREVGMRMIGVLSGGIGGDELLSAPAAQVYDDARTLTERLDEVLG